MNDISDGLLPPADADLGTAPRASANIRHVARKELEGTGQIVTQGHYAFVGFQKGPGGTAILDIADPRSPKVIADIAPPPGAHSHKVRVVGDIMVCNVERHPGQGRSEGFTTPGFRIFDIKDKTNPKLISAVQTFGKGVHRFDMDENYAYISTEMDGFVGNILVIYDIRDPVRPREVGRWWVHGQHVAGGEPAHPLRNRQRLHHGMRCGEEIYMGYWHSGIAIANLSDISRPKTIAHRRIDSSTEPTHTFMKIPHPIGDRDIAVSTDEERSHRGEDAGKTHAPFRTWDVTDPTKPTMLAEFHVPEGASPYHGPEVRFGTHQLREIVGDDNICYVTWFAAGLRIIDINDPDRPKEIGYFIPKPGEGYPHPFTNDIAKDDRGLLFVTDKHRGLDVIEFTG